MTSGWIPALAIALLPMAITHLVSTGAVVSQATVAGQQVTTAQAPGMGVVAGGNGCWAVAVMGRSLGEATTFGQSLLSG